MELRGRRIIEACGALWHSVSGCFLMSLPYEAVLDPRREELRHMLFTAGLAGARFPSLKWNGLKSGLYVFRGWNYGLQSIHIKHRPRVRRGLQHFEVRPAKRAELLEQGLRLNLDTLARQGRHDPEFGESGQWERLVEAVFECPQVVPMAAFTGNRMSAYIITCREGRWLHILHQMSRQEDLAEFPNHVLTYCVTKQAAADASLEAVSYGCVPLFSADGLHEYKLRFGYEIILHRSAIQLHPALDGLLTSTPAREVVRALRRLLPQNQRLETLETVLRGARLSRSVEGDS
jgi:hypothetical protein